MRTTANHASADSGKKGGFRFCQGVLRRLSLGAAALSFATGVGSSTALGKSGGPPNGVAGNPPEFLDCSMCHFDFPTNSGFGGVEILGLPESFEPGVTYELEVLVQDPDQIRWGFEMTVLDDSDPLLQGGQLAVIDEERTQISLDADSEVDYLKHTLAGTDYLAEEGRWLAGWTAPGPEVESVTFYVAGNAADGNFDFTGDFIYTSAARVERAQPTPTLPSTWGRVKEAFIDRPK